ncbi:methyltransferase, TIGR04325 family [Afipia sp. TerB]
MLFVWEGIYRSFAEAPASGPGFSGERWRKASEKLALQTLEDERAGRPIDFSLCQRNAVLPAVVAMTSALARTRILDVGGGLGSGYTFLRSALKRMDRISYDVVEVDDICRLGAKYFADYPEIRFLNDLPTRKGAYDIVYLASALQYIDGWQDFLGVVAGLDAEYVLLSDVLAARDRSFVTLQNYYESKIPARFISEKDLQERLAQLRYELILELPCLPQIRGETKLPMSNFPDEFQVDHARHFLFQKTTVTQVSDGKHHV